jgi:hypothetical protein
MHRSDRLALIKSTLSAMSIHTPISLKIPVWVQKVLVKLMKAFLWSSTESVQNGKCLLAWSQGSETIVYLGGLGVLDLEVMGHELRTRWLWFKRIDTGHPWGRTPLQRRSSDRGFLQGLYNQRTVVTTLQDND